MNAESVQDYWHISLLNSNYKIIAKCLASRLSPILNNIVDDLQSVFLKGHNVSNCFVVAQEILHLLHSSQSKGVMIKLDFEKIFDNVNWDFLLNTLVSFSFGNK